MEDALHHLKCTHARYYSIVPFMKVENGVYGDLVIIYPKPCSICLRGTIALELSQTLNGSCHFLFHYPNISPLYNPLYYPNGYPEGTLASARHPVAPRSLAMDYLGNLNRPRPTSP